MTDERTVEELIADAENATAGTVCAALDAIRQEAVADGITVTVDLYGKLVDLEFSQAALTRGASDVAQRVRRLVAEATVGASRQGMAALAGITGLAESPLAEEIRRLLPAEPEEPEEPNLGAERARRAPRSPRATRSAAREPDREDNPVAVTQTAW